MKFLFSHIGYSFMLVCLVSVVREDSRNFFIEWMVRTGLNLSGSHWSNLSEIDPVVGGRREVRSSEARCEVKLRKFELGTLSEITYGVMRQGRGVVEPLCNLEGITSCWL